MKHIVCLGYAKCGTTMLDSVFRGSRLVATPLARKEIKFFLPPQYPAEDQYAAYLRAFFDGRSSEGVSHTFEASPPYCHQEPAAFRQVLTRIRETLPDPKVVICLRHPVARAYSHYIHNLHNFGLFGEGVFSEQRKDLVRKVPRRTFVQALRHSGRLMTHYQDCLQTAWEVFGRDRVQLFFLEWDVERFRGWVEALAGADVADDVGLSHGAAPNMVIPRRPVPNYVVRDGVLYAFGSRKGELVAYDDLTDEQTASIIAARDGWTLSLSSEQIAALTHEHFAADLRACAELTGDSRFLQYVEEAAAPEDATLADERLLQILHGIGR